MISLWNDDEAARCGEDPLALRVYTSRLIGADENLVLHGGGNTSVKGLARDPFGVEHEVVWVKGSGWDLATIEAGGFAPVRLAALRALAERESLSDSDMVRACRQAMLDPDAPTPSVEAILHAIIPATFVDHTHADPVVTLCGTPDGPELIRRLYGERMVIVPWVMAGFDLAKRVFELTRTLDWSTVEGLVLLHHGIFTFDDDGRRSYELMIDAVGKAEAYLNRHARVVVPAAAVRAQPVDPIEVARIRALVSRHAGAPRIATVLDDTTARAFANHSELAQLGSQGPLTPDHVIRTRRLPLLAVHDDLEAAFAAYADANRDSFERLGRAGLTRLDGAPAWVVRPPYGVVCCGPTATAAGIVSDIVRHTTAAILRAHSLGGWRALPEPEIFAFEYWELEQAKLRRVGRSGPLQGKIALVTGAASGIGRACAARLLAEGAAVVGLDRDASVGALWTTPGFTGLVVDVTDDAAVSAALATAVCRYGGLDILVSNAGNFPADQPLERMDPSAWDASMRLNLTSHQRLLTAAIPYLKLGIDPAVVLVASKNVPAPGPGAGAYSVAKAGLTQLGRVAALELGPLGIRVNTIHPNAVFDTAIWSDEVLEQRARSYGLSVEDYRSRTLLGREVRSSDVAALVSAMVGEAFACTTGAQVPVDGGNERVV